MLHSKPHENNAQLNQTLRHISFCAAEIFFVLTRIGIDVTFN
jgi:hypothetical protein